MTSLRACFHASLTFAAMMFGIVDNPVAAQEGFFERDTLTGDWGGVRKHWEDAGVALGVTDVSETLSNPTGGIRQLTIYQGLLDRSLTLDLEKLAKWPGATFYTDGYWISGEGLVGKRDRQSAVCQHDRSATPRRGSTISGCSRNFSTTEPRFGSAKSPSTTSFTSANTRLALSIRRSVVRTPCRTTCRAAGPAIHLRFQAPDSGWRQPAI